MFPVPHRDSRRRRRLKRSGASAPLLTGVWGWSTTNKLGSVYTDPLLARPPVAVARCRCKPLTNTESPYLKCRATLFLQCLDKVHHLNSALSAVCSFVSRLSSGPLNGLFDRISSQDTEYERQCPWILRHTHVILAGVAQDYRSQRNHCIILLARLKKTPFLEKLRETSPFFSANDCLCRSSLLLRRF